MLIRQRVLLGILLASSKEISRFQLMKLGFLLRRETCLGKDASFYDFVPYKHGPFSFVLFQDLIDLTRNGYLKDNSTSIVAGLKYQAEEAVDSLPSRVKAAIDDVARKYSDLSAKSLRDHVYKNFPWYANAGDSVQKIRNSSRGKDAIFTIGYEGRSVDTFFNKILQAGVERLIDVRNNAFSRKYGFSREAIERLCSQLLIEYFHFPELGIPSSERSSINSPDEYARLFELYEEYILPQASNYSLRAAELAKEKPSVLVCFELDPKFCHRGRLAVTLSKLTKRKVVHL